MRRVISIVFCLWAVVNSWGVEYHPISFGSTSSYLSERTMSSERTAVSYSRSASSISASSISASNFASLNSEGGACYSPASMGQVRKVSRPQADDTNEENLALGEINFRSPIGEGMILLLLGAAMYARRRKVKIER